MRRNGNKPHDDAGYRKRRRLLMESVTPSSRCGRCGKLAREHPRRHKSGRPARWQAGHVVDGENRAPLRLEWSTCNERAGAQLGYRRGIKRWRERHAAGPHNPIHFDLANPSGPGGPPCARSTGELCAGCADWLKRSSARGGAR